MIKKMEDKRNTHHNKSFNLPNNNKDRKGLIPFLSRSYRRK